MIPAGIQIGVIVGLVFVNASLVRMCRLALRRNDVLLRSLAVMDELIRRGVSGTLEEDELRLGVQLVETGLRDEQHAQEHVRPWQRIPKVGQPWPDSLLAPVLTEDDFAPRE